MLIIHPVAEKRLQEARKLSNVVDEFLFLEGRLPFVRGQFEDHLDYLRTFRCWTEDGEVDSNRVLTTLAVDRGHDFLWHSVLASDGSHLMTGGVNYHGPLVEHLEEDPELVIPNYVGWSINT